MAGKYRTQIPRPPTRKRKPSVRPLTPRPKGEDERTAVRRLAAMKYRLARATYRVIAEKLTEERAREYADAKGISVERAMKQLPHVSKRTAWDDVTAELEGSTVAPKLLYGCIPSQELTATCGLASAQPAGSRRCAPPSLRSGPPGDPPDPLRLRRLIGPSGSLPARSHGPERVRSRKSAGCSGQ